jgi:ATP-dependent Clp protease ATP-binding subunit ClpX
MEPKNALIKQYTTLFERYGSELRFTGKALKAIAEVGLKRGGGARGLRGVLEEVLGDAMFEVPGSVCVLFFLPPHRLPDQFIIFVSEE